jgi:hypothetical protein
VDFDCGQVGTRPHDLVEQLVQRVGGSLEPRGGHLQRLEHGADLDRREREVGFRHRHPLLEAVVVHLLEVLDVH